MKQQRRWRWASSKSLAYQLVSDCEWKISHFYNSSLRLKSNLMPPSTVKQLATIICCDKKFISTAKWIFPFKGKKRSERKFILSARTECTRDISLGEVMRRDGRGRDEEGWNFPDYAIRIVNKNCITVRFTELAHYRRSVVSKTLTLILRRKNARTSGTKPEMAKLSRIWWTRTCFKEHHVHPYGFSSASSFCYSKARRHLRRIEPQQQKRIALLDHRVMQKS